jgi:hypothetical protein
MSSVQTADENVFDKLMSNDIRAVCASNISLDYRKLSDFQKSMLSNLTLHVDEASG